MDISIGEIEMCCLQAVKEKTSNIISQQHESDVTSKKIYLEEDDLVSMICELSAYRRGFIQIKIDFPLSLFSWKDSNHWFNNFVKSINKEEKDEVIAVINNFLNTNVASIDQEDTNDHEFNWLFSIETKKETKKISGLDIHDQRWYDLSKVMEKIGRNSFSL